MSNKNDIDDVILIVRIAHVVGRVGLAMAGAMCGTFVAAQLTMINAALFEHFTRTRTIRRGIVETGQDSAAPDFGRPHPQLQKKPD